MQLVYNIDRPIVQIGSLLYIYEVILTDYSYDIIMKDQPIAHQSVSSRVIMSIRRLHIN